MRTNLTYNKSSAPETMIYQYIEANASDALVEKINAGKKTIAGCMAYVKECARHKAVGNCAMVEDKEVYGWVMHFFEEDGIKEDKKPVVSNKNIDVKPDNEARKEALRNKLNKDKAESKKPENKPKNKPEKKEGKEEGGQITFDDLFASGLW